MRVAENDPPLALLLELKFNPTIHKESVWLHRRHQE